MHIIGLVKKKKKLFLARWDVHVQVWNKYIPPKAMIADGWSISLCQTLGKCIAVPLIWMASGSPKDILLALAMRVMVLHTHFNTLSCWLGREKEEGYNQGVSLAWLAFRHFSYCLYLKVLMGDEFAEVRDGRDLWHYPFHSPSGAEPSLLLIS